MSFKEKKSAVLSEADTVKSELAVLKSSHKNEIQRLHVNSISLNNLALVVDNVQCIDF